MSEDAMKKAVASLKENSRHYIEIMHHMAKNNRTLYEAYLAQHFTEGQALELVCRTGLSLKD